MAWLYRLQDKIPVPVPQEEAVEWSIWFSNCDRRVAKHELPNGITVSTVFLGIDHSFNGRELILFETMIFGGEYDEYQWRYST